MADTMLTIPAWLQEIPVLPLEVTVPVRWRSPLGDWGWQDVVVLVEEETVALSSLGRWVDVAECRIDLSNMNGYGYALRLLYRRMGSERFNQHGFAWAMDFFLTGRSSDIESELFALARAHKEISR